MAEGSEVDRVDACVLRFLNKCLPLFRDSFLEDDHRFSGLIFGLRNRNSERYGRPFNMAESLEEIEASGVAVLLR